MKNTNLTTIDEKQKAISNLLRSFKHKGELLLPDDELYPEKLDEAHINFMAKKIFVWLGIKPHNLSFTLDINHRQDVVIPKEYSTSVYECAAYLAVFCVEYVIHKKGLPTDIQLREQAIIEFGLGLLIINAIGSGERLPARIRRIFHLQPKQTSLLKYYSPKEFARNFSNYVTGNELHPAPVLEHTVPWARNYLHGLHNLNTKTHTMYEPFVMLESKRLLRQRIKISGSFALAAFVFASMFILLSHQPKHLSSDLQAKKDTIETLQFAYQKCQNSLKEKFNKYNSDDIFLERQIDAHASRCESLKNRHDYYVNEYNQALMENNYL